MKIRAILPLLALMVGSPSHGAEMPMELENKIALGAVSGRIDHMAVDLARRRLFVAELGNDSIGVVDLAGGSVLRRITGVREPQGVAYVASTDSLYAASARDGSVSIFGGDRLDPLGRIELGDDADNIRVDPRQGLVYVGYGSGAIAAIDPVRRTTVRSLRLPGHPEGFQLDPRTARIYVNVPDERQIIVVDRNTGAQDAMWKPAGLRSNFPMAIDAARRRVLVVFRSPARLAAFAADDGVLAANVETCGDADDVFVDAKRDRVFVSCGDGYLDVFAPAAAGYARIAHVETVSGARTALFVPELDRLYLAVRARGGQQAAIWVYRPAP
jgi:DNA-binding beta-propeller fold protein YncE